MNETYDNQNFWWKIIYKDEVIEFIFKPKFNFKDKIKNYKKNEFNELIKKFEKTNTEIINFIKNERKRWVK